MKQKKDFFQTEKRSQIAVEGHQKNTSTQARNTQNKKVKNILFSRKTNMK